MTGSVMKLRDNLNAQIKLYEKLEDVENRKNEAILNKKGALLKSITSEEEYVIKQIDITENKRLNIINDITKETSMHCNSSTVTLKDIAKQLDDVSASIISNLGIELKKYILSIKSINEVNMRMMKDNVEYFKIIVEGIKGSIGKNEAYSSRGEHRIDQLRSPLIFNKTV